jgi:Uma2 family endonuclease
MATITTIPVSEYLSTSYRPDRDYIDGEIQERNLGELDHGSLQLFLGAFLLNKSSEWHIRVATELRVQVNESRFRIPDICVMDGNSPREQVVRHPPILCIEVLSPDDTVFQMRDRIHDFINMGVPQVWMLNPKTRTATICEGNTMVEQTTGNLVLPGTKVVVSVPYIFTVLDQA